MGNASSGELSEAEERKIFEQLDTDSSGELSLNELISHADKNLGTSLLHFTSSPHL